MPAWIVALKRYLPEAPILQRPIVRHVLFVALLAEIGYAVLNISTMPVYLAAKRGSHTHFLPDGRDLGPSVISFVLVAFLMSEALFKSPMGALADKFGARRLMLIGPCITCVTSLLTALLPTNFGSGEIAILILLRVADGIGAAMLWPAAFALISDCVEDAFRQQAMTYINTCYMLGIALAPLIGGFANDMSGHKWASLFLSSAIFGSVAVTVYSFIPRGRMSGGVKEVIAEMPPDTSVIPGTGPVHPESSHGFGELTRALHEIPFFLVLAFATYVGIGFPMVIVKLFAQDEFGMSELGFGGLVFPAALTMGACNAFVAHYGERIGRARAVHIGMGMCCGGLAFVSVGAFVSFFRAPWALALGGIPIGLGFLLAIPAWTTSVSEIDPKRRGSNLGAVMTAQGVGAIIGAPLGGALYEKLEPFAGIHVAHYSPFIGCAACIGIGWLLSLKLLRDPAPSKVK